MKKIRFVFLLTFTALLSCNDNCKSKLFESFENTDKLFNYKLNNECDSVFHFTFTHPTGRFLNNKVYPEVSIDWFLKKQDQTIFCRSHDQNDFQPLFSFNKEDSIQTYLFENNYEFKIQRTSVNSKNDEELYLFRIIDYRCSSTNTMKSKPPFEWCDLVFLISEDRGFMGVYFSLYGDEIFDDRYNEYIYYPLGLVEMYLNLDSVKVMGRVSNPDYIAD